MFTELLSATCEVRWRAADDSVVTRQQPCDSEVKQARQKFALGQIAGCAENHDDVITRALDHPVHALFAGLRTHDILAICTAERRSARQAADSSASTNDRAACTLPAGIDSSPASNRARGSCLSVPVTSHSSWSARARAG